MNKLLSSLVVATLVGSFAFAQPALADMALKGASSMDAGSALTLIKDDKAAKCAKRNASCVKKAKGDEKKAKKCAAQLKKCEGKGKK